MNGILGSNATWMDRDGQERPITLDDIVIIAPYNAQVFEIQKHLPAGARVGTVDKFQGQEAPIAIYSTATSSHADAPRGMEFLYSLNRLNVATSRATMHIDHRWLTAAVRGRMPHTTTNADGKCVLPIPRNGGLAGKLSSINGQLTAQNGRLTRWFYLPRPSKVGRLSAGGRVRHLITGQPRERIL